LVLAIIAFYSIGQDIGFGVFHSYFKELFLKIEVD